MGSFGKMKSGVPKIGIKGVYGCKKVHYHHIYNNFLGLSLYCRYRYITSSSTYIFGRRDACYYSVR